MYTLFSETLRVYSCGFVVLTFLGIVLLLTPEASAQACPQTTGFYNIKTDFGAAGDNTADDTDNITAAMTCIASRGGGTLYFPEGAYKVINTGEGIALPSGVNIVGASGRAYGPSRIVL